MPHLRCVPNLTDLVYQPVCELIKQEALKVSNNCVTKFHFDEEEAGTEDLNAEHESDYKDTTINQVLSNEENDSNGTKLLLTLEEHISRRYDSI